MSILGRIGRQCFVKNHKFLINSRLYAAAQSTVDVKDLDKVVKSNKVVVFMKGNPEEPRCGFSNAVVQIMRMHGVKYDSHDVLQNEELRQAVKDFSNWPTIPQVYINGEFVGGCDIMVQMHQNGELIEELDKVGIKSALLEKDSAASKSDDPKTKKDPK